MLMEDLFSKGIMTMGPSRFDPNRRVSVFAPRVAESLATIRASALEGFRWIAGKWTYENAVPGTRLSPAYVDVGTIEFSLFDKDGWISSVSNDGVRHPWVTFDPFSQRWIYVLTRGSFGVLRSEEGWVGNRIAFEGLMTMLGIDCVWRMTWTREGERSFRFVNEERSADGSWAYIDEWRFTQTGG